MLIDLITSNEVSLKIFLLSTTLDFKLWCSFATVMDDRMEEVNQWLLTNRLG